MRFLIYIQILTLLIITQISCSNSKSAYKSLSETSDYYTVDIPSSNSYYCPTNVKTGDSDAPVPVNGMPTYYQACTDLFSRTISSGYNPWTQDQIDIRCNDYELKCLQNLPLSQCPDKQASDPYQACCNLSSQGCQNVGIHYACLNFATKNCGFGNIGLPVPLYATTYNNRSPFPVLVIQFLDSTIPIWTTVPAIDTYHLYTSSQTIGIIMVVKNPQTPINSVNLPGISWVVDDNSAESLPQTLIRKELPIPKEQKEGTLNLDFVRMGWVGQITKNESTGLFSSTKSIPSSFTMIIVGPGVLFGDRCQDTSSLGAPSGITFNYEGVEPSCAILEAYKTENDEDFSVNGLDISAPVSYFKSFMRFLEVLLGILSKL